MSKVFTHLSDSLTPIPPTHKCSIFYHNVHRYFIVNMPRVIQNLPLYILQSFNYLRQTITPRIIHGCLSKVI